RVGRALVELEEKHSIAASTVTKVRSLGERAGRKGHFAPGCKQRFKHLVAAFRKRGDRAKDARRSAAPLHRPIESPRSGGRRIGLGQPVGHSAFDMDGRFYYPRDSIVHLLAHAFVHERSSAHHHAGVSREAMYGTEEDLRFRLVELLRPKEAVLLGSEFPS